MKTRTIRLRPRSTAMHAAPRGAGPDREPVIKRTHVSGEPTMCERCGAVYRRKTWRAGERTRRTSPIGVTWTVCPACTQVADAEYFGRVSTTGPLGPAQEAAIRRRVRNVEQRAGYTQPERRTVRIEHTRSGFEILTTSQKLAHRIGRELEKAFGGRTRFTWTTPEGSLEAVWDPPAAWRNPSAAAQQGAKARP
jgi:NMD protein affecting ribosome stability and mRNA decay